MDKDADTIVESRRDTFYLHVCLKLTMVAFVRLTVALTANEQTEKNHWDRILIFFTPPKPNRSTSIVYHVHLPSFKNLYQICLTVFSPVPCVPEHDEARSFVDVVCFEHMGLFGTLFCAMIPEARHMDKAYHPEPGMHTFFLLGETPTTHLLIPKSWQAITRSVHLAHSWSGYQKKELWKEETVRKFSLPPGQSTGN